MIHSFEQFGKDHFWALASTASVTSSGSRTEANSFRMAVPDVAWEGS
jgi:hypothetical protein